MEDAEKETAEGTGGAGHPPATSPAQPQPQPKVMCASVVSTAKRQRRRQWEARTEQGLRQRRTAMGPQYKAVTRRGRRGRTKNLGKRE